MSDTSLSNLSSGPLAGASAGNIAAIPYDASFEVVEDDEAETQNELNKTFTEIGDTTFKDTGLGLRTVHAKSHGLLRGELKVLDVAAPYAQGLFAAAKAYPVALRFSTAPGDLLDDNVSTPRGLAIKVIGVDGARLPGGESQRTQDFLLTNGKAFTAPNPKKFLSNLKLLAATTDRVPKLKQAFSAVLQSTEALLESLGTESATLKSLGGHPESHLLGETFYSQVPFLYGTYMAKFSVAPISPELIALKDVPVDLDGKPDGLRAAVVDYFAAHGGEWEFRVQLCTDLDKMPIEDATVEWPEEQSPFVAVARLSVSPQLAWSDELSAQMDDGLSFAPWHGLMAHRPLGSINRARRVAYPTSADLRSPRGRCPVHEPSG